MIKERIRQVRQFMQKDHIDAYYINASDYHQSEYLADYFQTRVFMSGFTGSFGYLFITQSEAFLYTDGRYFIQAERELQNSDIQLMRIGQEGVLDIFELIQAKGVKHIGFDGRCVDVAFALKLESLQIKMTSIDYVSRIWKNRPALPKEAVFEMELQYVGVSRKDKLQALREKLHHHIHVVAHLDAICYVLNIRGGDIKHTPVVLSYMIIDDEKCSLFIDTAKLSDALVMSLHEDHIDIYPYDDFYNYLKTQKGSILMDFSKMNYEAYKQVQGNVIYNVESPIDGMKACKNEVELKNIRFSHITDGIVMVKFIHWLKETIKKEVLDELTITDTLNTLRKEAGAFDLSFEPIVAYNANAAMMHYSATPENYSKVYDKGILLVDSGGQYLQGTTDITRTIALGSVDPYVKQCYTTVLKSMLNLQNVTFLHGCSGMSLDVLARQAIWKMDLDYQSGTGHGIGYVLGVHEGPHGIKWKKSINRHEDTILQEGMVVTDEPGIYLEHQFGIRIENELVVKKKTKNFYGQFMEFEVVTYCPFDLELIDTAYLNHEQVDQINQYHQYVYQTLSPYLDETYQDVLKEMTKELHYHN